MMKRRDLIITIGFCAILAVMQAAFWLLPKTDFSVNEKRVLQRAPSFSLSGLWDGSWFQSIDSYVSDHFAGRDFWVGLHAYANQAEGLNAAGKVYRGKDGWLINRPLQAGTTFEQNVQALSEFAQQNSQTPVTFLCIPTTGAVMEEQLPNLHDAYPDRQMLAQLKNSLGDQVEWIDGLGLLQSRQEMGEAVYYRTDHHWTSAGAYAAYCALAQAWGMQPADVSEYSIQEHDGFYGTTYSKSGLWAEKPDTIALWEDQKVQIHVQAWDDNKPFPVEQDGVFFLDHLKEPDKYPVFLDGNHAKVTLTSNADGGKLLIVRDSFAHCFAPFLSRHFKQIDLVDLRYFKKQTVSELIEQNQYDRILFVYGLETVAEDRSLQWLA